MISTNTSLIMKTIFIILIYFFPLIPLAYAQLDSRDLCIIDITHDYKRFVLDNDKVVDEKIDMRKGNSLNDIWSEDIQYDGMEDFGGIQYGAYKNIPAILAKYSSLFDCHIKIINNPPYYALIANNPLEHLYQQRYAVLWSKYEDFLPGSLAETGNMAYDGIHDLLPNKNVLCLNNWRFCFDIVMLLDAYYEVHRRCFLKSLEHFKVDDNKTINVSDLFMS